MAQQRQVKGAPAGKGGEFKGNEHGEATGALFVEDDAPESASERSERYLRDHTETFSALQEAEASGILTMRPAHLGREYSSGPVLLGRDAHGSRIYAEYRATVDSGVPEEVAPVENPNESVRRPVRYSMTYTEVEKGRSFNNASAGGASRDAFRTVVDFEEGFDAESVNRLADLGDAHHLNDFHAGTSRQSAALAEMTAEERGNALDRYDNEIAYLRDRDLLEDDGYRYGTKWLMKSVPSSDVHDTLDILSRGKAAR